MIDANSVLDELRRLGDERQTGVLVLSGAQSERISISFCEGLVEAASSSRGNRRLGEYLVKDEYLTSKDLDAVQEEAQRQKIVFGEAIVKKKLVAHGEVGEAVRRQSLELIAYGLEKGFKVASFTNSLRSFHVPARVTFYHVLLELSRNSEELFEPPAG